ncbi:MAG: flippase-like domain-containing protein [Chitinivibrionia bacterium]|nr:flippase-like domain-containing protein [Chitinivibrionia bacterium]
MRFDRRTILKGVRIFFGLSVASIAVVFLFTMREETLSALRQAEPGYLILALLLINSDWFGSGLRLFLLSRRITKKLSYMGCVKAAVANTFMANITPSQTGGGPAQIYVLYKEGLPVVESMSVSLMTFLATVFFLVLSTASIRLFGLNDTLSNTTVRIMFEYGVSLFLIIGLLVILFVCRPALLRKTMTLFFDFISRFRRRHFLRPGGRANHVVDVVDRCHQIMIGYFRHAWGTMLLAVMVTGAVFLSKFVIAYLIVRGLGVEAGLWEVVSIQILITLATYFIPTPGATGAAELGSAVLMAGIVPVELLMVYVVLWRAITAYSSVSIGTAVMLRSMGKETVMFEPENFILQEKKTAP